MKIETTEKAAPASPQKTEEQAMPVSPKKEESPEAEGSGAPAEEDKMETEVVPTPPTESESETPKMGKRKAEPEAATEEKASEPEEKPKKKRRSKKEKKEKKKRKLNHQCAAVKICHAIMQGKRNGLPEEDQGFLAKFCQLNRGPQGIMFNKMCVKMREHLKERYPTLEKWEDMDYLQDEHKPKYAEVVDFLLEEYVGDQRKQRSNKPKEEDDKKASEEVRAE